MINLLKDKIQEKDKVYVGIDCSDIPREILDERVYIVGDDGKKWLAIMICPCGCKTNIQLSLLKEVRPRWRVQFTNKKRVTIRPSIRRTTGCKSHFNLINGRVHWH